MNTWLAFMYTHAASELGLDRMVVTPELVVALASFNDDSDDMGFGSQRVSHLCMSRVPSTYVGALPPTFDSRLKMRRGVIDLEVLRKTVRDVTRVIDKYGREGLLLMDLFLRASKAYQDHNHSSALISFWAIIEKLLQELWQEYQDQNRQRDGQEFIDKKRADRLNDGRTFTSAVIAEILSLVGELRYDIFQKLSSVRKSRNDWMHNLKENVSAKDAVLAAEVCEEMLNRVRGISVISQRKLRIHS